jgi:hypothetical protein
MGLSKEKKNELTFLEYDEFLKLFEYVSVDL